jgi:hypothetical protein
MTGEDLLNLHAMPVLRRLMAEIVSHMFGPEHAAAALKASDRASLAPGAPKLRLLAEFDASLVIDTVNGFDVAAGYYQDQRGVEGHGPIDAYEEEPEGHVVILHGFLLSLVRRVQDATQLVEINPRALCFKLVGEGESTSSGLPGRELVFDVRELKETFRKLHVSGSLALPMACGDYDAAAAPRQKL